MPPEVPDWLTQALDRLAASGTQAHEQIATLAAAQARTDERFAAVEAQLERLAAAQAQTEGRLARIDERLATFQAQTEERLARLEERFIAVETQLERLSAAQARTDERLATFQAETEKRLARLEERFIAVETQIERLTAIMAQHTNQFGELRGWALEARVRDHAPSYLGRIVRRVHVLTSAELERLLYDAADSGIVSEDEAEEVRRADVVCKARAPSGDSVFVVAEVSSRFANRDIDRALALAQIVAKLGEHAIPVVVGQRIDGDTQQVIAQPARLRLATASPSCNYAGTPPGAGRTRPSLA